VINNGMAVVDAIANLAVVNASGASNAGGAGIAGNFSTLPVYSPLVNNTIQPSNLVTISAAFVLDPQAECLFNWAESQYGYLFNPAGFQTTTWREYNYRYYSGTNSYLGVSSNDNHVYYLGPDGVMHDEGALAQWLPLAGC
jgi:hypothetical protein